MTLDQETNKAALEATQAFACRHHWMIEAANGPVSLGVCRNCFEAREFRNSALDHEKDTNDLSLPLEPVAGGVHDGLDG